MLLNFLKIKRGCQNFLIHRCGFHAKPSTKECPHPHEKMEVYSHIKCLECGEILNESINNNF